VRKLVLGVFWMTAILAAACKHPGSTKLEGRWKGVRAEGVSAERQHDANTFAVGTQISAKGNVITITTPQGKPQQGTYFVDDENKTTLVIHTDKDGPAAKETFAFGDDGKTMTWRIGEGRTIVFEKQKD
jgi:hypothetical protein